MPLEAWENKRESSLEEDIFIQDLKLFVLLVLEETTDNGIQGNKSPYMRSNRIKNCNRKRPKTFRYWVVRYRIQKKKKNPYCANTRN